jgi:hypothetical protein
VKLYAKAILIAWAENQAVRLKKSNLKNLVFEQKSDGLHCSILQLITNVMNNISYGKKPLFSWHTSRMRRHLIICSRIWGFSLRYKHRSEPYFGLSQHHVSRYKIDLGDCIKITLLSSKTVVKYVLGNPIRKGCFAVIVGAAELQSVVGLNHRYNSARSLNAYISQACPALLAASTLKLCNHSTHA